MEIKRSELRCIETKCITESPDEALPPITEGFLRRMVSVKRLKDNRFFVTIIDIETLFHLFDDDVELSVLP